MGILFIALVVLGVTTVALMSKLSAMKGVPALDLSLVIFIASTLFSAALVAAKLRSFPPALFAPKFIAVAACAGAGGSIAVFAFNRAIRIGHFGFSNAIYRSSFLIPVLVDCIFFGTAVSFSTIIGILFILVGIFFMSWSEGSFKKGRTVEFRWFVMIMLAFFASGMPRLGQLLTANWNQNYFLYLLLYYAAGAIALLAPALQTMQFNRRALWYGSIAGLASCTAVFSTLKSLELMKAQVVFPVTLSAPIIITVLLSMALFRETIRAGGWIGVVSSIAGIITLALGK
jgi:drug/metabolite transporter (DMT)-like permease